MRAHVAARQAAGACPVAASRIAARAAGWAAALLAWQLVAPATPASAQTVASAGTRAVSARSLAQPRAKPEMPRDPLEVCVDRTVRALEAKGARQTGPTQRAFLLEKQSRNFDLGLDADGCVALLAVGPRSARDLDMFLHRADGTALLQDQGTEAHAYLSYCGHEGEQLVATVRMHDGRGELHVVRLQDAPTSPPDLDQWLAGCTAAGGGIELAEVGPEPEGPRLEHGLRSAEEQLAPLGYRPLGGAELGELPPQRREAQGLRLAGGRCFAVAAVGGGNVQDIDLRVFSPLPDTTLLGVDGSQGRQAIVKLCTADSGVYIADVRMYRGSGPYALQLWVLEEPASAEVPDGMGPRTRIAFAEQLAQLQARGLAGRSLGWGMVAPNDSLSIPVALVAGECYGLALVPSLDPGMRSDLDLSLLDARGNLVAWDVGPGAQPLVFHCAERTAIYRVVGSAHGPRRFNRYLLLLGEDPTAVGEAR